MDIVFLLTSNYFLKEDGAQNWVIFETVLKCLEPFTNNMFMV